jgi:ribonuclease Z
MRVEFLGTSGFHPTEKRHTSCVLLPELGIVFDAGTGMFRLTSRLETKSLSIFLSHSHLDHIVGLTYLLPPLYDGTIEKATIYGSARTINAVQRHLFAEEVFPVALPFEFVEVSEQVEVPEGGRLSVRVQQHPGESLGYRIDWPDRSLAYVTDTTALSGDTDFVRGVDLLIHECNFRDDLRDLAIQTGHSHTTPVCELARDAGVKRLVLTHFDPYAALEDPVDVAKARKIFPHTEVAEDKMVVEF